MTFSVPTITDQSGMDLDLQSVEILDARLLLRFRVRDMVESGPHRTLRPLLMEERPTLTDTNHVEAKLEQSSSAAGPFAGIVDLAFCLPEHFDTVAPLTLRGEHLALTFTLH